MFHNICKQSIFNSFSTDDGVLYRQDIVCEIENPSFLSKAELDDVLNVIRTE